MRKNLFMTIGMSIGVLGLLIGCSAESGNNTSGVNTSPNANPSAPIVSEVPEPVETSENTNSATLGDYEVEIKSAVLTEDYEGNPAIVVTYSWTNNSSDTESSMTTVSCSAFQDGIELDTALIMDDSIYDSGSFMREVRPGTTIDIQSAFVLSNTTSIVEVEVEEWITFEENPPVAYMEFDPSTLS